MLNELTLAQWWNIASRKERKLLSEMTKIPYCLLLNVRYGRDKPSANASELIREAVMKISRRRVYFDSLNTAEKIFLYRPIKTPCTEFEMR